MSALKGAGISRSANGASAAGTAAKQSCRLCYYDTSDTVDLFGPIGIEKEYVRKIAKYLYLLVEPNKEDDAAHSICWMCSQNLEAFHQFYTKINEIQLNTHKEDYEAMVIPDYVWQQPEEDPAQDTKETVQLIEHQNIAIDMKDVPMNDDDDQYVEQKPTSQDPTSDLESQQPNGNSLLPAEVPQIKDTEDIKQEGLTSTASTINDVESPGKRKRGRPRKSLNETTPIIQAKSTKKTKRKRLSANSDLPIKDFADEDDEAIDEDVDFPTAREIKEVGFDEMEMNEFRIVENGVLVLKGAALMRTICKFYTLDCELCTENTNKFKDLHELFSHYMDAHETKGYVQCCKSRISRYSAIVMHMASHLQPDAFKCDICGYIVTRPRFLEAHRKTHLPDEEKPYTCDICSKCFVWKNGLRTHMIKHQRPEDRRKYICDKCGKVYDKPSGLTVHKKMKHTESQNPPVSPICHICAKTFATRTGLNEHMATIHQPREFNQLQCTVCGKWVMNKRCLKTHMLLHSDIEIKCDQCPYVTKKNVLLTRHIATKHSGETPFGCDKCSNAYKTKRALVVHKEKSHGKKLIYKCNFCERMFNSSTNFYTHRKLMHPVELAEMRRKDDEKKRLKRIFAGIEDPVDGEVISTNHVDGPEDASEPSMNLVYELTFVGDENNDAANGSNEEFGTMIEIIDGTEEDDDIEMEVIEMPEEDY